MLLKSVELSVRYFLALFFLVLQMLFHVLSYLTFKM